MELTKQAKGSIGLEVFRNRLRLRLPRSLFNGKQTYLSLGLADTQLNRKITVQKIRQIEQDILSNNFDSTLVKYKKPQPHLAVVETIAPKQDITKLWEEYCKFKKPNCAPGTWKHGYVAQTRYLAKCPHKLLGDAQKIFAWIVENIPADSAKRLVVQLSACCDWAMQNRAIAHNPFAGLSNEIKVKKINSEDNDINPFDREERDAIIAAFKANRYYKHYANYVRFLFLTGARPSEVIALQWKHISSKSICFEQVVVNSVNGLVLKSGLKTQSQRIFPVNAQLLRLINEIKQDFDPNPESLVFPSPSGGWIDTHNFRNRAWKTILESLEIEYRKPYQTRHTFVTMALEADVSVPQIAKWVGNSPQIIMERYAGMITKVAVPEF